MGTVSKIARSVIPAALYDLVFQFATGDIKSLRITALTADNQVRQYKFGEQERAEIAVTASPAQVKTLGKAANGR